MGWVSADVKCGYCGVASSDYSPSTRKSNISGILSSSLSPGSNYVNERVTKNISKHAI